jgi:hypothetical protein
LCDRGEADRARRSGGAVASGIHLAARWLAHHTGDCIAG